MMIMTMMMIFCSFCAAGGKSATLDFLALETEPGRMVKVVSMTSTDHVTAALDNRDPQMTAGHLVSLMVAFKGKELNLFFNSATCTLDARISSWPHNFV